MTKLIHVCLKLDLAPLLQLICLNLASKYQDQVSVERQHGLSFHDFLTKDVEMYMKMKYDWATKETIT